MGTRPFTLRTGAAHLTSPHFTSPHPAPYPPRTTRTGSRLRHVQR